MYMKFWSFQKIVHYVHSLLFNRIHTSIEFKDYIEIMIKTVWTMTCPIKDQINNVLGNFWKFIEILMLNKPGS
jgi:hypothetical protein